MATPKTFFILAISLALAIALSMKTIHGLGRGPDATPEEYKMEQASPADDRMPWTPLRRILAHSHHGRTTRCTKDHEKCKHHEDDDENNEKQHHKYRCCKKKCMDLSNNSNHCGHCNKRCSYGKTCCRGKCVWLASNRKNCGSCNNHCPKDVKCILGTCNYA